MPARTIIPNLPLAIDHTGPMAVDGDILAGQFQGDGDILEMVVGAMLDPVPDVGGVLPKESAYL